MSHLPGFPGSPPMERGAHLQSLLVRLQVPPNRAPVKRNAPFLEPSFHCLSQFPLNGPPPHGSQQDPSQGTHLSTEPSASHPLKIHLSLRVPGKKVPSMFLSRVRMERENSVTRATSLSMYVCHSPPKKEPSYKMGKNIRSPSMEPHADGKLTYNGVWPGSSRRSLMTLLSLPQCHAALGTIPSNFA